CIQNRNHNITASYCSGPCCGRLDSLQMAFPIDEPWIVWRHLGGLHQTIELGKLDVRPGPKRVCECSLISLVGKTQRENARRRKYAIFSHPERRNDLPRMVQTNIRTKLHQHSSRNKRFIRTRPRREVDSSVFLCSSS